MSLIRRSPEVLLFVFCLSLSSLISCGPSAPKLEGIDIDAWRDDKEGCGQVRTKSIADLDRQRRSLLKLSEIQILKLLGKPDENELYERNQKFYRYYLEPGPSCDVPATNAKFLSIRFNATGRAQEVAIE